LRGLRRDHGFSQVIPRFSELDGKGFSAEMAVSIAQATVTTKVVQADSDWYNT